MEKIIYLSATLYGIIFAALVVGPPQPSAKIRYEAELWAWANEPTGAGDDDELHDLECALTEELAKIPNRDFAKAWLRDNNHMQYHLDWVDTNLEREKTLRQNDPVVALMTVGINTQEKPWGIDYTEPRFSTFNQVYRELIADMLDCALPKSRLAKELTQWGAGLARLQLTKKIDDHKRGLQPKETRPALRR